MLHPPLLTVHVPTAAPRWPLLIRPLHAMASLTAFFKPVPAPNATPKKAAAAATPASSAAAASSASPASSPKPTAASRKRKSVETESKEGDPADQMADEGEQPAAVEVDDVAAKKMKVAGLEDLIPKDWAAVLKPEFSKSYWPAINKFLKGQEHVKIFPQRSHIFRALELCPFDNVNVVILGQDPYHDDGQAEGLCFSVPPGVQAPSSLRNIYKELADDLGSSKFKKPNHGNLVKWAQQGILLLNTGLTVEAHKANSHKSVGWFNFTDAIIKAINKERKGVVFILWGAHAQAKAKFIDAARHHILKSVHPSGLSASKGFYGCKHFSKTNELLKKEGKKEIDWQV